MISVEWNGPWTGCVLRPYPDYVKTGFHYLMARETPTQDDAGNDRPVDDFQPRAQLKAPYKEKSISSSDEEKVKAFSAKYVVPENLGKICTKVESYRLCEFLSLTSTLIITVSQKEAINCKKKKKIRCLLFKLTLP